MCDKTDWKTKTNSTFVEITSQFFTNGYQSIFMGSKRITILIDDDLILKLRQIQAQRIKETNSSVNFSNIINELLKTGLKK